MIDDQAFNHSVCSELSRCIENVNLFGTENGVAAAFSSVKDNSGLRGDAGCDRFNQTKKAERACSWLLFINNTRSDCLCGKVVSVDNEPINFHEVREIYFFSRVSNDFALFDIFRNLDDKPVVSVAGLVRAAEAPFIEGAHSVICRSIVSVTARSTLAHLR